jgi:FkbM family methyltransferase
VRLIQSVCGPFWVWENDHLGNVLESGAFWDAQLLPFLEEATRGWALDLGANVGVFSRWLSKHHDHVIAVEAHPETFHMLRENVLDDGVECVHGAAYDQLGVMWLAPTATVGWQTDDLAISPNASSVPFLPTGSEFLDGRSRKVATLAWVGDKRLPSKAPITVIKCDVQGCDLRALKGLQKTIARCRPLILFEYEGQASSWHGDSWEDYLAFFESLDYGVERVREDIWDFVARPR